MNTSQIAFFLSLFLSSSFIQSITPASVFSALIKFPLETITLAQSLEPNQDGVLELQTTRIEQLRDKFAQNFALRDRLKYLSYAAQGSFFILGLYQLGFFNGLISNKDLPQLTGKCQDAKDMAKRLALLEKSVTHLQTLSGNKSNSGHFEWILNGAKTMSQWFVLGLVGMKVSHLKNYVEATPRFSWFFSTHSITDRIDVLKRGILKSMEDTHTANAFNIQYNAKTIAPDLQTLAHNLEELISFTEYYFDQLDQELLIKHGMDMQPRYLFNISNDFFKAISTVLKEQPHDSIKALLLVDDFRTDIITAIKRCQFFERDFLAE